ncbi:unnamed protein product [Caretta caretta]
MDYKVVAKVILLQSVQEKVFNRMDHGYLLGTLQAFGFRHLGFLTVRFRSVVRLNWNRTGPVSFGRGVHQGCPLSGQLYTLAIEPFLHFLCKRLTELMLHEPEVRLVLVVCANDAPRGPGPG